MYSPEPLLITIMIKGRSINAYFAIFYFNPIGQEILPDWRERCQVVLCTGSEKIKLPLTTDVLE